MGAARKRGAAPGGRWPGRAQSTQDQVLSSMVDSFTCYFPGSNHNRPMDPAKRAQLARRLDKKVITVGYPCPSKQNSGERAGGTAAAKAEREIDQSL